MNKKVQQYLDSIIPKSLSKKSRKALYDEMLNHIKETADFYMEIGYSEGESIDRALEGMGESEDIKASISSEFEDLYVHHNSIIRAVLSAVILPAFSLFYSFFIFAASRDVDSFNIFGYIPFILIPLMLVLYIYADKKRDKKMHVGLAVGALLSPGNAVIFLDVIEPFIRSILVFLSRFTPLYCGEIIYDDAPVYTACLILSAVPLAGYIILNIAAAVSKFSSIKNPLRKLAALIAAFAGILFFTALFSADSFIKENPWLSWDDCNYCYSCEETDDLFDKTELNSCYQDAAKLLEKEGYITLVSYESSLKKGAAESFREKISHYSFNANYEVWFNPSAENSNIFIYLRQDNSIITGKGTGGEMFPDSDSPSRQTWGAEAMHNSIIEYEDIVRSLQKGQSKESVLKMFKDDCISEFSYTENGCVYNYYRNAATDRTAYRNPRQCEMLFKNGKLEKVSLYVIELNESFVIID